MHFRFPPLLGKPPSLTLITRTTNIMEIPRKSQDITGWGKDRISYTTTDGGKIAMETLLPFSAPVLYNIYELVGGRMLYTTGSEAENSAVSFQKKVSTTTV